MALYQSKGTISDMSEVQSGTSQSGNQWQRMTLTLEIPGFQGSVTKQFFRVSGNAVNDVLLHNVGDRVEVTFSLYAREWNGKLYNNVDLVKISPIGGAAADAPSVPVQSAPVAEAQPEIPDLQVDDNPKDDLPF